MSRFFLVALFALAGLGALLSRVIAEEGDSTGRTATEFIAGLDAKEDRDRENAADALAELDDPRIVPALREHLKKETDFHVRLALHYALATQGEKSSVAELIASLKKSGHLGSVYLRRISGKEYGWNIADWEAWDRQSSAESFQKRARELIRERPAREEWRKFLSTYTAAAFEELETDDAKRRSGAHDRKQLGEMPTARAWKLFESAIEMLQDKGDRKTAAKIFRDVATNYAGTYYAKDSKELADLLDKMVKEDLAWKEPKDVSVLSRPEQIAYHIYHLRDVVAHQWSQPGYCNVLSGELFDEDEKKYNAAKALRALGEAAIPALLDALDDRRPIRGVGYWRHFHPTRTILRYQDAAIQILNEILPGAPYTGRTTSSYLSNEDADDRARLIGQIRKSWQRDKDKSVLDRRWSAVDDLGIYPALKLLGELAEEPSEKAKVVKKLGEMYDARHWVYQPRIVELMAKLGDTSKVQEVLKHHRDGRYRKYLIQRPDDSGASLNAEDAAKRLAEKYADAEE